jgi:ABC-type sulfate transport system permease subunit
VRTRNSAQNIAQLRSHERHIKLNYRFRGRVLALATLTILIGAVMVFAGLHGSFDWAVEAPHAISAKLTNASPGIVFATIGMILGFVVVLLPPIKFQTGDDGTLAMRQPIPFFRPRRHGK